MKFEKSFGENSMYRRIELAPGDDDEGVFEIKKGDGVKFAARISIHGVKATFVDAMAAGDEGAAAAFLAEYVEPVEGQEGTFRLRGCAATAEVSDELGGEPTETVGFDTFTELPLAEEAEILLKT